MKAADDQERLRRLDGNLARGIRLEPERGRIDAAHRGIEATRPDAHREAIHTVAVAGDFLEVAEMHADVILAAGDFRRIGATCGDRGDDRRIRWGGRVAAEPDAVAGAQTGIGGEPLVDRDGSQRPRRGSGVYSLLKQQERQDEHTEMYITRLCRPASNRS